MVTNIADAINWTDFAAVISGMAGIIPSIVTLVVNFVPLIIILSVVGFVVKFFDTILDALQSAFSFIKR
jgi:NCAIR mutase (PurE)-related protein